MLSQPHIPERGTANIGACGELQTSPAAPPSPHSLSGLGAAVTALPAPGDKRAWSDSGRGSWSSLLLPPDTAGSAGGTEEQLGISFVPEQPRELSRDPHPAQGRESVRMEKHGWDRVLPQLQKHLPSSSRGREHLRSHEELLPPLILFPFSPCQPSSASGARAQDTGGSRFQPLQTLLKPPVSQALLARSRTASTVFPSLSF